MKPRRPTKHARLPADQMSRIYDEIVKCNQEIGAPHKGDKPPPRNDNLRVLSFVAVLQIVPWIFVWLFPHNAAVSITVLSLYVLGVVLFVVFQAKETVRSVQSGWARIKRGALDDFLLARRMSEIESRFVNDVAHYDESVRRFTVTELTLLKNELESWPKVLLSSFATVGAIVNLVLAVYFGKALSSVVTGFFGKSLAPFVITVALLLFFVAIIVFAVILVNNASYSRRISDVKRIIALIGFSLGDFDDSEDKAHGETRLEAPDEDDGAAEDSDTRAGDAS